MTRLSYFKRIVTTIDAWKISGDMVVAVPHQYVINYCWYRQRNRYDIIAQMTMKVFAEGHVPITSTFIRIWRLKFEQSLF